MIRSLWAAVALAVACLMAPAQGLATPAAPAAEGGARILFIAGFASAFDDRERLSGLFAVDGVTTEAFPPGLWLFAVHDAAQAYRRSGGTLHIVLVGHSMGAIRAYEVAAALGRRGIPVDLVIGFDPTREAVVSGNVARAVNFFLTPDVAPVVPGPDFHGVLVNDVVGDIAAIPHHDIIYDEALHRRALREIERAIR